eukprot:6456077-Amphidinium_carterae.1
MKEEDGGIDWTSPFVRLTNEAIRQRWSTDMGQSRWLSCHNRHHFARQRRCLLCMRPTCSWCTVLIQQSDPDPINRTGLAMAVTTRLMCSTCIAQHDQLPAHGLDRVYPAGHTGRPWTFGFGGSEVNKTLPLGRHTPSYSPA